MVPLTKKKEKRIHAQKKKKEANNKGHPHRILFVPLFSLIDAPFFFRFVSFFIFFFFVCLSFSPQRARGPPRSCRRGCHAAADPKGEKKKKRATVFIRSHGVPPLFLVCAHQVFFFFGGCTNGSCILIGRLGSGRTKKRPSHAWRAMRFTRARLVPAICLCRAPLVRALVSCARVYAPPAQDATLNGQTKQINKAISLRLPRHVFSFSFLLFNFSMVLIGQP